MAKQAIRRAVIRERMALPREKRQADEQTADFAAKAVQRHKLPRNRREPQNEPCSPCTEFQKTG